ncbi:ATP-grasp peptide maturase system methyltransferase [Spongiactinospora sp. TRM90649]|uniref:ATP-grasp peptide maturase system methyltransferase n=1 Tax=Spongiactinospora sp. TRM90649 TaxID=3031114 RepID=UPI0023FA2CD6|nr:ATP-grasp peptide maturase system methyltransferase [Spongiactinospora sp. TRM90649]MDF5753633.1 ATP-grasp peptide maturase system methyltransferase [Spongiactinospora sp. TRM90649]
MTEAPTYVLALAADDDRVVRELAGRGATVHRVDVGDFPLDLRMTAGLGAGRWEGELRGLAVRLALRHVTGVYYRRPTQFRLPEGMSGPERLFAYNEARRGLGGVLHTLDCLWINHPIKVAAAEYKPVQLATARACGLAVPETLITNDPESALRLARRPHPNPHHLRHRRPPPERHPMSLAEGLADMLVQAGAITDPTWREVFASVPRHHFVPHFAYATNTPQGTHYRLITSADPAHRDAWLKGVYSDTTLLTHIEGEPVEARFAQSKGGHGRQTSSSTQPSLMARMLHALDLRDHHTVLEIGTGTGYNAALLSRRLGGHRVTSIDIDPELTKRAEAKLAELGLYPKIRTADGRQGHPACTPYDRMISTCALPYLPPAWIEQTRPGGLIITNLAGLVGGAMLLAEVGPRNTARGRFLADWAGFMPSRHPTKPPHQAAGDHVAGTTRLSPKVLDDPAFAFCAQLHVHNARRYWATDENGRDLTGLATPDGSWAEVYEPDADGSHLLHQAGPARLWSGLEEAYAWWRSAGRPNWKQYAFRATPDEQRVSCDGYDRYLPVE